MYELADGSLKAMNVAVAKIDFVGEFAGGVVIFGAADAEPLLSDTAPESIGIEVGPRSQQLKRLPVLRLKRPVGM